MKNEDGRPAFTTDAAIAAHYSTGVELDRLAVINRLEFERTKQILLAHLPRRSRTPSRRGSPTVE